MNTLKNYFLKAGGISLLKQYWKSGVLFTAIVQFILLGRSKKSLEILRHIIQNKLQKKLQKKYKHILQQSNNKYLKSLPSNHSNKIWFCWLQGIENAPKLVQICYKSIKYHLSSEKEIILITSNNLDEYVKLPDYIIEKWESGIISNTLFSDIIRMELLINHGGTWIDSTVLCTGKNFPKYMFDSNLFLFQILKPGRDGHSIFVSSWFISAKTNNKILMITRDLMYEYWKTQNFSLDYFLFHMFLCITLNYYSEEFDSIPKECNSNPHILLLQLFNMFDAENYSNIIQKNCFHKLSYKFGEELLNKKGTYYDIIINDLF